MKKLMIFTLCFLFIAGFISCGSDEENNTGSNSDEDAIRSPAAFVDEMGNFCNLLGQQISKPLHGMYIKGGKKYVFCR